MQVDIITLFPEMFEALSGSGISGRAINNGLVSLHMHNPRDYAEDRHQSVDDRPYGGGPGMVMTVPPLGKAIQAARQRAASVGSGGAESEADSNTRVPVIYLSPQGEQLNQQKVMSLVKQPQLILLCGRYEGIDERLVEAEVDEELSIGDYVISGGELAAMVLLDAMIRQVPGALGDNESAIQDSYMDGLLDCPHYSRPEEINGRKVPAVLLSGDHQAIRRWRRQQSLLRTQQRRPDLFAALELTDEDRQLLATAGLADE